MAFLKEFSLGLALSVVFISPASADVISPSIDRDQEVYSQEAPNAAFFGRGVSGRMSEASHLRFNAEQCLMERRYKDAYRAISKAVQLDPGDPTGHVMLARSMTGLLRKADGNIDEDMLARAIKEWKLIAYHDADLTEQLEAKGQLRKLGKVAKAIKKERAAVAKARSKEGLRPEAPAEAVAASKAVPVAN